MNVGLILAGGNSERMVGIDTPKQFVEIGGIPLIKYSLQTIERCEDIDLICVVADEKRRSMIGNYIYAEPGISRQHSIYNGLLAVKSYAPKYVVVHDSARPLLTVDDICNGINASRDYDGATPSLPVTETIYRSFNGKTISSTLNRDELLIGQTPECYDFEKYLEAHERCKDMLAGFRGSSEIAVNAGMKIAIYNGNAGNFKVTTNGDLERFKALVEEGKKR